MRLYYGSETYFVTPTFGEGNPSNDYGLGFYMTDSYEVAKLWASKHENGGYILTFDIDTIDLQILNLKEYGEENILRWISILVSHRFKNDLRDTYSSKIMWLDRKFHVSLNSVDFIIGYRADDSYFNYSKDFVADNLSFEILSKAMKIGKLGLQYVAISKKAFSKLKFVKSERVPHTNEYDIFQKKALDEFHNLKAEDKNTNTYFRDLIRKYGE